MTDLLRVPVAEHRALSIQVLTALGVPEPAARDQAELLLEGDLRGHASHGLRRLDMLAQRLRSGAVRAAAQPTSTWTTESVLVIDGDGGLGPPVARRAVEELIAKVAGTGVVVAAVRNANHLGMLAPYVESMADAGVIGIALTTSEALVHPWGGTRALVGTNPLAIAVPTLAIVFWMTLITTLAMTLLAVAVEHARWTAPGPQTWGAIAYNAVMIFGFAQAIWLVLARDLPPIASTMSVMLIPVLGTLSGAWWLGERLHWQDGAAIVLLGIAIAAVMWPKRAGARQAAGERSAAP